MENQLNQDLSAQNTQSPKAALYLRVASRHQADADAINIQKDALHAFAKQQGYAVCMEYSDNGFSGLNLDRPAFAQMDAEISAGNIDTVIVRNIDRISRDYLLAAEWIGGLESRNAKLIAMDGSHAPPVFTTDYLQEVMKKWKRQRRKGAEKA